MGRIVYLLNLFVPNYYEVYVGNFVGKSCRKFIRPVGINE